MQGVNSKSVGLADKLRYYMGLAKQGDQAAFAFIRHYALQAIIAYVGKKVEHADVDAEEIAELAFDNAERSIASYSMERGEVLSWLKGVAWHTIGSYYRSHGVTRPLPQDDKGVAVSVPSPEEIHNGAIVEQERDAQLLQLDKALRELPLRRRQVLIWHHIDRDSYLTIANRMDISIEAARQLHHNALEDMRKILVGKASRRKGRTGG